MMLRSVDVFDVECNVDMLKNVIYLCVFSKNFYNYSRLSLNYLIFLKKG